MKPTYDIASAATQGMRPHQEDCVGYAARDPMVVAVLADGMGGHAGGAIASRLVCETFLARFSGGEGTISHGLVVALDAANDKMRDQVREAPHLDGMGSTIIAVAIQDGLLEWISVGDSPLYLIRAGEVALINEDHSLAPALDQMAAAGRITSEQARNDPRRHMLRSAVTGEDIELIDLARNPLVLSAGDVVVLASDGIHTLELDEIARIVKAYGVDGSRAIAAALVRAVDNARAPMQDNASVIVIQAV